MRLYRRSKQVDLNDTIALCDFDADHGRVKLALERLRDLEEEVGADAKISYAEGLLWRDFLGQGEQAYQCFVRAHQLNPQHRLAACNATSLAPTEIEFRQWAEVASRLSPPDAPMFQHLIQQLKEGTSYQQFLIQKSAAEAEAKLFSGSSALLEIALSAGELEEIAESQMRRSRAQSLRMMDREAETIRATAVERFPPEERLSLREAVLELDRAIALDEYDAELWNLRSAWCVILERNEEAILAADRAIGLRPSGYPKPYHNKARALWNLKQDEEALATALMAKQDAQAASSPEDLRLAELLLSDFQTGRGNPSEAQHMHIVRKILEGTEIRTHEYAGLMKGTVQDLCGAFATRLYGSRLKTSLEHVGAVAQLMAYLPAEAAGTVLRNLRRSDSAVWSFCFEAMCYVIVKGEPVMRRDASRVAALLTLDEPTLESMRNACRERLLAPAAADPAEFGTLVESVGGELRRLNLYFPGLLLEQPPLSQEELRNARSGILVRLSGTPFTNDSGKFQQHLGCTGVITLAIVAAAILFAYR